MIVMQITWSSIVHAHLEPACDDFYTVHDLKADALAGNLSIFGVFENDMHMASMALRFDGDDLVVVCLGGRAYNGSLIMALSDFWDRLAKAHGAKSIRAHVSKKGMTKLMERVGGRLAEYVYRKEVA